MADVITEIDWLARARGLAPIIAAAIPTIHATGKLPDGLPTTLHAEGMYQLLIPRSCGGFELDPVTFAEIIATIASYDASTAWVLGQVNGAAMSAAYLSSTSPARFCATNGAGSRGVRRWPTHRITQPSSTAAIA